MDQRLQNAVSIGHRVIGAQVGGLGSASNAGMRKIAAAVSAFIAQAQDINESMLGASAKGIQLSQRSGPMMKEIGEAAKEIAAHRASVEARMNAPVFQPWETTVPAYHTAAVALTLAQRFHDAAPADRARTLASIIESPHEHADVIKALLVVPSAISGVTTKERAALHSLAFETMKPDEAQALDVEIQQLSIAGSALRAALGIAREHGGDTSALPDLAPDAVSLMAAQPLRRVDPRSLLTEA